MSKLSDIASGSGLIGAPGLFETPSSGIQPLFMEETFLINLYGSDDEIDRFYELMDALDDENVVELIHLIEDIKRRNLTKIDWNCCHRCNHFTTCRINWYRGERDITRNCCSLCTNYEDCIARMKREDTEDVTISCNYMETKKTDREIVIQTTNSATESDSVTTVISSTKTEVFEFDGDNGIRSSGVHLERKTTSKDETPKLSE